MPRHLGYGGLANTGIARSFAGKAETEYVPSSTMRIPYHATIPRIPSIGWRGIFVPRRAVV